MELWVGALVLGLIYAIMTIGVYITYRILDFPDITVDGSFTLGAAVSAMFIVGGYNPYISLFFAFLAGGIAGIFTGLIHTKMKVNGLLAGILVMIALYSINLHIMGKSNVPLLNFDGFNTIIENFNPGLDSDVWLSIIMGIIIALICTGIGLFFRTDLGLTLRATGDNPIMSSAQGVNVDTVKIFGIALSNGFVGLSGAAIAQYQGFADIGMGIGMVVNGLAAVIIGEAIIKNPNIYTRFASAALGAVVFRFMIAFALFAGMNPIDLKLLTALFVLLTLYVSIFVSKSRGRKKTINFKLNKKNSILIIFLIIISISAYFFDDLQSLFSSNGKSAKSEHKIGIVQITSNGVLDITRESFLDEMKKLGYDDNTDFIIKNANGDVSTLNNIIDNFILEKVDLIVAISTPATQAAMNKVKDIPVVFATVANPFILKAGTDDNNHLPNITGTYGWAPMDKTLELVTSIFGDKLSIGTIWDIGQTNSEFNIHNLKKELLKYPNINYTEATVNNSSEVQQAAASLINKKVDLVLLPPDNTVYSAFDAILKATNPKNIPVIMNDVERLPDGGLAAIGYDYSSSGIAAAGIVKRILNGEKPADIPFQKYTKLTYGLNLDVADKLGIKFNEDILYKANLFIGAKKTVKKLKVGIVQFAMEPNVEIAKQGILHALEASGYKDGQNLEIIYKNANADFPMINSIMQDLIARYVDVIVPLSTPVVQSAVQMIGARKEPTVVFTYIYDPYKIGAAKSPTEHLPNFTGVSCFPPLEGMMKLIKDMSPDRKKIGIVWNSSEANSEAVTLKLRSIAKDLGLELLEQTVTNPNEVLEASRSLVNKGAQVFLNAGDNTLNVSYDSYAKVASENKIPLYSVDSELIYNNTLAALGPDYYRTGFDGGIYIAKILDGENPEKIPIKQTTQTLLYINKIVADKINYKLDDNLLNKANKVIRLDSNNADKPKPVEKQKTVAILLFNENVLLIETKDGILNYFKENNILSKYNLKIDYYNAQGDFSNAQIITKDIIRKQYDYIITASTPALQTVAGFNDKIPHIFGAVTSPYVLGIAESPTKHRANITGVATLQPVESSIKLMRDIFPAAKRIGILWNSSEACSQICTEKARAASKKYNFELIEQNVTSISDIQDGLKSLLEKKIDLFFTSGDNTVVLASPQIANVLKSNKIPYFTNTFGDVKNGAFASLGADYHQVGTEVGKQSEKVFSGNNIKEIPIIDFIPEKLEINKELLKLYKIKLPKSVQDKLEVKI